MLFYTFVRADTAASSSSAVAKSRIFYTQADESRWRAAFFTLYALLPSHQLPFI